jgi:hypothetical protein
MTQGCEGVNGFSYVVLHLGVCGGDVLLYVAIRGGASAGQGTGTPSLTWDILKDCLDATAFT